ncbi:SURF1 family protein [Grimontia marina]|uniref:SURF1-like protein n=1 Tax=Grimontia marina TaxID=646534 RepID=A0A128F7W6_9GAMM|nr:SURF1 family protein [Grimontia marina]CZF82903.1 SURF1 family protein [Grimontia marina]
MSSSNIRQIRRIGFLVFTLAMTALLVKLGMWQMSRGAEKEALLSQLAERSQQEVTALASLPQELKGTRVKLAGQFDTSKSMLLDNQTFEGRVGYRWFLPFRSDNQWVLVELGWVAAPATRETLPALPTLDGSYSVSGTIDFPSERVVLAHVETEVGWPQRVQSIDIKSLEQASRLSLKPWLIRGDVISDSNGESFSTGAKPIWEPVVMKPEKHYAYAMQWFGLALVVVIGFGLWWRKGRI